MCPPASSPSLLGSDSYLQRQHSYLQPHSHSQAGDLGPITTATNQTEGSHSEVNFSTQRLHFQTCDPITVFGHSESSSADPLCVGCHHGSNGRVPLVFSHLEPTTTSETERATSTNTACCVSTPFHHSGMEPDHHCPCCAADIHEYESETGHHSLPDVCEEATLLDQLQSLSVSQPRPRRGLNDQHWHIPSGLDSHSAHLRLREGPSVSNTVASNHSQWAWPRGHHGSGSCRNEVLGVGYVDDVTVDDLAGYFDQMLHLPKPMSEMAQLMYT